MSSVERKTCPRCNTEADVKACAKGKNVGRWYAVCPQCPGSDGQGKLFISWVVMPPSYRSETPSSPPPQAKRPRYEEQQPIRTSSSRREEADEIVDKTRMLYMAIKDISILQKNFEILSRRLTEFLEKEASLDLPDIK